MFIKLLNDACVNEAVLFSVVTLGEVIPEARLVVEVCGSYGLKLAANVVVRTEEVTEVVNECQLNGVLACYEVVGKVCRIGRPENCINALAVNLYSYSIYTLTDEIKLVIGGVKIKLAAYGKLAREEGIALLFDVVEGYLFGGSNYGKASVIEGCVALNSFKLTVASYAEVTNEIQGLNLHIVGELVLLGLKDSRLSDVIIGLFRHGKANGKLDNVLANLNCIVNVKHSECAVAEIAAIGLVDFNAVDLNGKYLGSFAREIKLFGYILDIGTELATEVYGTEKVGCTRNDVKNVAVLLLKLTVKPICTLVKSDRVVGCACNVPFARDIKSLKLLLCLLGRARSAVVNDNKASVGRDCVLATELDLLAC